MLRNAPLLARRHQFLPAVLRKPPPVARRKIFGCGCPNQQCYAGTGFRANRRERTSGPDEGSGSAKQKDGVCPTTLDRAKCPDQKEEFAVQPTRRTSPPFPDVSPKACGGRAEGPRRRTQGLWWQGRRSAATNTRPVVAGQKVRGDGHKACDGNDLILPKKSSRSTLKKETWNNNFFFGCF